MARSGGGGSHSGGTHRSSSSYSRSSSSSSSDSYDSSYSREPRISHSYFQGATRFAYYEPGGKVGTYYALTPADKPDLFTYIMVFLFTIVAFGVGCGLVYGGINIPKKVVEEPAPAIVIDGTGMFGDTTEAVVMMQDFTDHTGITAAIKAVNNEDWAEYYDSAEVYAFEQYYTTFDNEDSLLVLYSQPKQPDPAFNDWYYEIIYGDNTIKLLTDSRMDTFNTNVYQSLINNPDRPAEAIAGSIKTLGTGLMDRTIIWPMLIFAALFFTIAAIVGIGGYLSYKQEQRQSEAVRVDKHAPEKVCEYCGTHYIVGMGEKCHSCGAPIDLI
ncbi:MAG: hypothetical protein HUJ57_08275 [Erysipelotrichaceae bacterium]|nr:hypothetical protein [Erysipelotrichaceae bacterium]